MTAVLYLALVVIGPMAVALVAVLLVRRLNRPWFNGVVGELRVRRWLRRLDSRFYRTFNNIYLPGRDGRTTEVDHLVVSSFGVFVIETKNFSGDIHGSPEDRRWTLRYRNGRTRPINSPVKQNRAHVNAVVGHLGLQASQVTSIVVLVGRGRPMKYLGDEVVRGREVLNRIEAHRSVRLAPTVVDRSIDLLERRRGVTTRRQHVAGVRAARALSAAETANRRHGPTLARGRDG